MSGLRKLNLRGSVRQVTFKRGRLVERQHYLLGQSCGRDAMAYNDVEVRTIEYYDRP